MSRLRKLSQTLWHCQYHIVWCPKYRFRILEGEIEEEVEECVKAFSEVHKCELLELNVRLVMLQSQGQNSREKKQTALLQQNNF